MTTSIGPLTLRTGSTIRGAGVALACLVPGVVRRAEVVAASYAAAWPLGRPGLQLVVFVPEEGDEAWKQKMLTLATSGLSWTALMLLGTLAVRRSRVPAPVGAVLLGAAVAAADSMMGDVVERMRERALAAADNATAGMDEAAGSVDTDAPTGELPGAPSDPGTEA